MFCQNCGNEIKDNIKYCPECGAELTQTSAPAQQSPPSQLNNAPDNAYQTQTAAYPMKKKKLLLPIIIVIAVIAVGVVLAFWVLSKPDLSVSDVKTGELIGYDSKTIGKAFEDYFNDCSWEAFTAKEDEAISVVEFVGYLDIYNGEKIKVTVQFTHDSDYQAEDEFDIYIVNVKHTNGYIDTLSDNEIDNMINSIYNGWDTEGWL